MAELKKGLAETLARLKNDKKALFTVIIGISGMLLILLSELPETSGSEDKREADAVSYISQSLQKETERLISEISGAGKVSVMLTYDSSEEYVWAKDSDSRVKENGERDTDERYIIIDADDGETGLAVKVVYPRVRGVAVVCTGGDDPTVKSEIKALLSALFDIGANRISIARRAEQE